MRRKSLHVTCFLIRLKTSLQRVEISLVILRQLLSFLVFHTLLDSLTSDEISNNLDMFEIHTHGVVGVMNVLIKIHNFTLTYHRCKYDLMKLNSCHIDILSIFNVGLV